MSLLPEFNEKFTNEVIDKILNSLPFESIPIRWIKENNFQSMKDLLNPDLNPLTFEEVKSWFDRNVANATDFKHYGEIINEMNFPCLHYSINCYAGALQGYREVPIYINELGFSYSSRTYEFAEFNSLLHEAGRHHYNLLSILKLRPVDLFCQMKGYVDF